MVVVAIGLAFSLLGFSVELTNSRMDFHRHQQLQLFGLYMATSVEPFDSVTALFKEASDDNLWKLKPTPSRPKLRAFVRTGSHTSCVSSFDIMCLDFLALARSRRSSVHVESTRMARAPLSPEGRLRILLRQGRESDGHSLVWCASQSPDTPESTEDTTSIAAIVGVTVGTDSRN